MKASSKQRTIQSSPFIGRTRPQLPTVQHRNQPSPVPRGAVQNVLPPGAHLRQNAPLRRREIQEELCEKTLVEDQLLPRSYHRHWSLKRPVHHVSLVQMSMVKAPMMSWVLLVVPEVTYPPPNTAHIPVRRGHLSSWFRHLEDLLRLSGWQQSGGFFWRIQGRIITTSSAEHVRHSLHNTGFNGGSRGRRARRIIGFCVLAVVFSCS